MSVAVIRIRLLVVVAPTIIGSVTPIIIGGSITPTIIVGVITVAVISRTIIVRP